MLRVFTRHAGLCQGQRTSLLAAGMCRQEITSEARSQCGTWLSHDLVELARSWAVVLFSAMYIMVLSSERDCDSIDARRPIRRTALRLMQSRDLRRNTFQGTFSIESGLEREKLFSSSWPSLMLVEPPNLGEI